jgi:hypothetical protein
MKINSKQRAMFLLASAVLVALLRMLLRTRLGLVALFLGVAVGASCWMFGLLERAVLWMWKWSGAAAELVNQTSAKTTLKESSRSDESI